MSLASQLPGSVASGSCGGAGVERYRVSCSGLDRSSARAFNRAPLTRSSGRAVPRCVRVGVIGREGVAAFAVSLLRVLRDWRFAPQCVDPWRHGLKVARIHAAPVSAEVVQFDRRGINRANKYGIGGEMREPVARASCVKVGHNLPVTVKTEARPIPTSIRPILAGNYRKPLAEIHWLHTYNLAAIQHAGGY